MGIPQAAGGIEKSLKLGGSYKIIFVVQLMFDKGEEPHELSQQEVQWNRELAATAGPATESNSFVHYDLHTRKSLPGLGTNSVCADKDGVH